MTDTWRGYGLGWRVLVLELTGTTPRLGEALPGPLLSEASSTRWLSATSPLSGTYGSKDDSVKSAPLSICCSTPTSCPGCSRSGPQAGLKVFMCPGVCSLVGHERAAEQL